MKLVPERGPGSEMTPPQRGGTTRQPRRSLGCPSRREGEKPQSEEFGFLRNDIVLFTYLHLAAYPNVGEALLKAGTAALAYETVQLDDGSLPLLAR